MKKKNILFVCKYNRFRSKIAEFYLNKARNNLKAKSAGIIRVNRGLSFKEEKRNKYLKKEFGIIINSKSRGINYKLLKKSDLIIIVADDVPKIIFNNKNWKDKILIWKIPDEEGANKRNIKKIVFNIKKNINKLVEEIK
jgi:protein-tyrosine-phosphatase